MIKVGLLIVTDEAANLLDKQAITGMEIELVTLPDARFDNVTDATASCKKISKLIDDYIRENQDKESK